MKLAALFFLLTFSSLTMARQYIQCSVIGDTTDVAVVNLVTEEGGTLFLSSGMQNSEDERLLVEIQLSEKNSESHIYQIMHERASGSVTLPKSTIGKNMDSLIMQLDFGQYHFDFVCFSRIYHD